MRIPNSLETGTIEEYGPHDALITVTQVFSSTIGVCDHQGGMNMTRLDDTGTKALHDWPILLLRVYTGVFFAYNGIGKISRGNFADGMVGFLNGQENTYAFFKPFIDSVVLPNKGLFAFLVSWGELAIGIALILGLATRYAAIAGAVMVASFWFAKGLPFLAGQNHDSLWMMVFIVLATLHAGRVTGLDQKLAGRFRFLA